MAKKGLKLPRVTGLTHMQKLGLVFVAAAIFVYILKTQTSLLEGMTTGADDATHKKDEKATPTTTAPTTTAPATPTPKAKESFKGREAMMAAPKQK